jgi:hypothetical protein
MTELLSTAPTLATPVHDWEIKRGEHERRDAELRPFNKTAVFDALAAAGITIVAVVFDGYGDSGQTENSKPKLARTWLPCHPARSTSRRPSGTRPSPNTRR